MAKMIYEYAVMDSGKTLKLLQFNYNYKKHGFKTLLIKPKLDTRSTKIETRLGGLAVEAEIIKKKDDIYAIYKQYIEENKIKVIFIDEAQFLKKEQVLQLRKIVDILEVDVLAFGLRTNFKGELFEGSKTFMERADTFKESKTICHCGRKATMILKLNNNNQVVKTGEEIDCGFDQYISVCHKHWDENKPFK